MPITHIPRIVVWAILGCGNAGKSTVIGHLASQFGNGKAGVRPGRPQAFARVLLRGGGHLTVYARRQSIQEAGRTPEQIVKTVRRVALKMQNQRPPIKADSFHFLLALRLNIFNGLPVAHEYLTYFVEQGWEIASIAVLNPTIAHDHYHRFGAPLLNVYRPDDQSRLPYRNRQGQQIGEVVGRVRNHFGWA